MSLFVTNILKLNARQLLNKKDKKKKETRNFLTTSTNNAPPPAVVDLTPAASSSTNEMILMSHSQTGTSRVSPKQQPPPHTINGRASPLKASSKENLLNSASSKTGEGFKRSVSLGDNLLFGYKRLGKIVRLEAEDVCLVKFDMPGI